MVQGRNLMDQKTFKKLQSQLEKRWEVEAHRLHDEERKAERLAAQQQQVQQAGAPAAAAPAAAGRASLPPRAPLGNTTSKATQNTGSTKAADERGSQRAGQIVAEASRKPRQALGELQLQ